MFTNLDSSLYSVQSKGNYKKNQNKSYYKGRKEKNQKRSRLDKKQEQQFSLCTVIFAIIAKIRYDSENSVIAKIEIFAIHSNFRYDSENSSVAKFWHCSSLATVPLLTASFFFYFLLFFPLGL